MQEYQSEPLKQGARSSAYMDERYHPVSTAQSDLISEDLGTFLLCREIVLVARSVDELKSKYESYPELLELIDQILARLEAEDLITLDGDKIIRKTRLLDEGSRPEHLIRYVPNLFKLAVRRVIHDEHVNQENRKRKKEGFRYLVLPDTPEVAKKAREIQQEFNAKMFRLMDEAVESETPSDNLRFVGVINSVLEPEDFI